MAATAAFVGLCELLDWPTEHLTDASESWELTGLRSDGLASQVWRDSLSMEWRGEGADALRAAVHSDMLTTSAVADQLRAAAEVARGGASDLSAARSRLRYAVDDARAAGFEVGEDLSISDRVVGGSVAQRAARQAEAEAVAAEIVQRAMRLVDLDEEVAAKITSAVAGISRVFPDRTPDNHVRPVDNHWKLDPAPPSDPDGGDPWEDLEPPRTYEDVREAMRLLRRGENKPHRELDTPEEIERFYDWLTRGAVGALPPDRDYPGGVLADGTEVQLRPGTKSPGPVVEVIPRPRPRLKVHEPLRFVDDLPPWLKVSSPPGFALDPFQHLPVHEWKPPAPVAAPLPAPVSGGPSIWSEVRHDLSGAGEKSLEGLSVGAAAIGVLFGLGGRSGVPMP